MVKKEKGFTLIELMIVVAIIGILAAVAIPKFADLIDRAREAATKGNLGAIRSGLSIYYGSEEGEAPANLAGIVSGDYISKISGARIPYVDTDGGGSSDESYEWDDNTASIAEDYSNAGDADSAMTGWSYDSSALEIWVGLDSNSTDTKGDAIYQW